MPMPRLPIPVTLTILIALGSLYLTAHQPPVLLLFAAALLTTYAVPLRVSAESSAWIGRFALYVAVLIVAFLNPERGVDGLIDPRWMNFLGYLAAAEVLLQAWHRRPSRPLLCVLPFVIFICACNTYLPHRIPILAPLFCASLALAIPALHPRPARRFTAPLVVAVLLLAVTLGLGYGAAALIDHYRADLNAFGTRFLTEAPAHTAGISLAPALGATFGLRGSPRRVLRLTGWLRTPYLRALSFDSYARGCWLPTADERLLQPMPNAWPQGDADRALLHVAELAPHQHLLYVPLEAAALRIRADVSWNPMTGGPVTVQERGLHEYDLAFARGDVPSCWPEPTPAQWATLLAVPDDIDPRVRALARRIGTGVRTPEARIAAVRDYLLTHHQYSLSCNPGNDDPISAFLLRRLDGHCEYFAAATVVLLRCLGVPARYVVGYYAHEGDGMGGIVVRQRDAHAWAECWVDGAGWETVDATPGGGRPDGSQEELPTPVLRALEYLEDQLSRLRGWVAGLTSVQLALLLVGILAPYFAVQIWFARRRRLAPPPSSRYTSAAPDLAALARRFDAWLARTGTPCPPEQPWHDHLRAHDAGPPAAEFVRRYNATRFGPPTEHALADLQALLLDIERS